jgi:D-alanyl-D-alanine endopeptidase (penicillin-binding protein 7)
MRRSPRSPAGARRGLVAAGWLPLGLLAALVWGIAPPPADAQARAARSSRAARSARAAREVMTPRYKVDERGLIVPAVRAEAAIVFSPETGQVLLDERAQEPRSIASITKVMTALVFLEDDPDLDAVVTVTRPDVRQASTTYLRANERVSVRDLLHLALMASDNAAARVLARISHGGTAAFVARMNDKARELGLAQTAFADPSGLDPRNVSSAYDLSRLIAYAAADPRLAAIMEKTDYRFRTNRRPVAIHNTNRLVGELPVVGKTGFIRAAGYCLAALVRLPQGPPVAVVVLGAPSNLARFWETRHLVNWLLTQARSLLGAPGGGGGPGAWPLPLRQLR